MDDSRFFKILIDHGKHVDSLIKQLEKLVSKSPTYANCIYQEEAEKTARVLEQISAAKKEELHIAVVQSNAELKQLTTLYQEAYNTNLAINEEYEMFKLKLEDYGIFTKSRSDNRLQGEQLQDLTYSVTKKREEKERNYTSKVILNFDLPLTPACDESLYFQGPSKGNSSTPLPSPELATVNFRDKKLVDDTFSNVNY